MATDFIAKHGLFLSQLFFSTVGMAFSIAMLVNDKDASVYLPILTTIVGVWIPSPMSRQNNQLAVMQSSLPSEGENGLPRTANINLHELAEVTVVRD